MTTEERKNKIERLMEGIRQQLEHEPMLFDEKFTGKFTVIFNFQSGGISGNVTATRDGRMVVA